MSAKPLTDDANAEALEKALKPRAYAQGYDDDGWYRRCDLCDAISRSPNRAGLIHKDSCVLKTVIAAADSEEG